MSIGTAGTAGLDLFGMVQIGNDKDTDDGRFHAPDPALTGVVGVAHSLSRQSIRLPPDRQVAPNLKLD